MAKSHFDGDYCWEWSWNTEDGAVIDIDDGTLIVHLTREMLEAWLGMCMLAASLPAEHACGILLHPHQASWGGEEPEYAEVIASAEAIQIGDATWPPLPVEVLRRVLADEVAP